MEHLIGGLAELGWVAAKAVLLYLTAILGLRLGERRTLADLSLFDFVAAVAVGSVVGRLPSATDSSYVAGRRRWSRCSPGTGASRGSTPSPPSRSCSNTRRASWSRTGGCWTTSCAGAG